RKAFGWRSLCSDGAGNTLHSALVLAAVLSHVGIPQFRFVARTGFERTPTEACQRALSSAELHNSKFQQRFVGCTHHRDRRAQAVDAGRECPTQALGWKG